MKTKDKKEAAKLLAEARSGKAKAPKDETDILNWTMPELRAYIKVQTKGMNIKKKYQFGQDLIKRIEKAKKEVNT